MKKMLNTVIRPVIRKFGVDLVRYDNNGHEMKNLPPDFDDLSTSIFRKVEKLAITSPERVFTLIEAVKYVINNDIEGDLVECGVWKGGSVMAMALTLVEFGHFQKNIYLYDTFSGMSSPTEVDVSYIGFSAQEKFNSVKISNNSSDWCFAPLEEVRENVYSTGYPKNKFRFIKGKVEDTIPQNMPEKISLLRLDTDWYESTYHELVHLFPRLVNRGVLIIDDFGHWKGARRAVEEYFRKHSVPFLLNRIDYTARIGVKITNGMSSNVPHE